METKPGHKTSEFWAMIGAVVLAGFEAGVDPVTVKDSTDAKFGAIAIVAYIVSRGLAKLNIPYAGTK